MGGSCSWKREKEYGETNRNGKPGRGGEEWETMKGVGGTCHNDKPGLLSVDDDDDDDDDDPKIAWHRCFVEGKLFGRNSVQAIVHKIRENLERQRNGYRWQANSCMC